jgi:hypothetical protein
VVVREVQEYRPSAHEVALQRLVVPVELRPLQIASIVH